MQLDSQTLLIIFVAITGLAVLLQAFVLLGIFFSLRKAAKSMLDVTEDLKQSVIPMVHSTRDLVERLGPQLISVTSDLSVLTQTLRKESAGVQISVREILERVNHQTQRLDRMLTSGLNSVERAGVLLESAVALPVRQVNGIFAAAKAVVETYINEVPKRKATHSSADKDLFI